MFTCLPLAMAGALVFGLLYFISMGALRPLEWCCGNACLRATETRLRAAKEFMLGSASHSCDSVMCVAAVKRILPMIFHWNSVSRTSASLCTC